VAIITSTISVKSYYNFHYLVSATWVLAEVLGWKHSLLNALLLPLVLGFLLALEIPSGPAPG
jgi:hypothetical protein